MFVRAANVLKEGDFVIFDPVKIRFLRAEDFEVVGRSSEIKPDDVEAVEPATA